MVNCRIIAELLHYVHFIEDFTKQLLRVTFNIPTIVDMKESGVTKEAQLPSATAKANFISSLCLGGRSHGAYGSRFVYLSVCVSVCRQDFSSLAEN